MGQREVNDALEVIEFWAWVWYHRYMGNQGDAPNQKEIIMSEIVDFLAGDIPESIAYPVICLASPVLGWLVFLLLR